MTAVTEVSITPAELTERIAAATAEATHAFTALTQNETLAATRIFHVTHRLADTDYLITIKFPGGIALDQSPNVTLSRFSESPNHILQESRLGADTVIHAHTRFLSAWSVAHVNFSILYAAASRHLLAREIPNHLDRTRSVLDVIRERLDTRPDLAPVPALLESNGGANFWAKGILKTSELIMFIEEAARYQYLAEALGGAKAYTPGALELQWQRTGLKEKALEYVG